MVEFHFKLNSIYLKQIKIKPTYTKFPFVFFTESMRTFRQIFRKLAQRVMIEVWGAFGGRFSTFHTPTTQALVTEEPAFTIRG